MSVTASHLYSIEARLVFFFFQPLISYGVLRASSVSLCPSGGVFMGTGNSATSKGSFSATRLTDQKGLKNLYLCEICESQLQLGKKTATGDGAGGCGWEYHAHDWGGKSRKEHATGCNGHCGTTLVHKPRSSPLILFPLYFEKGKERKAKSYSVDVEARAANRTAAITPPHRHL